MVYSNGNTVRMKTKHYHKWNSCVVRVQRSRNGHFIPFCRHLEIMDLPRMFQYYLQMYNHKMVTSIEPFTVEQRNLKIIVVFPFYSKKHVGRPMVSRKDYEFHSVGQPYFKDHCYERGYVHLLTSGKFINCQIFMKHRKCIRLLLSMLFTVGLGFQ